MTRHKDLYHSFCILQYVFKSTDEKTEPIALESGLGQVYNEGYGYNILNQVMTILKYFLMQD